MVSTSSTGDWIGRSTLLNDGSKWIHVYRAGSQHGYDANARLHIRFSTDEGLTWTAENTFTDGNPVTGAPFSGNGTNDVGVSALVKAPNGDLLCLMGEREQTYTVSNVSQFRSTNGGASWVDEGVVMSEGAGNDAIVIGTDIYAVGYTADSGEPNGSKCVLYKSTDNGATWTKVSDIATFAGDNRSLDECSIANPSGNNLVVMMRDRESALQTFVKKSSDLGVTWGSLSNITSQVGTIQRPRLRLDGSRIYMIGRKYSAPNSWTVISYSDDGGDNWRASHNLEDNAQDDCGYADMLERADGNLYALSYRGTTDAATIYEYIVDVLA